MPVFFAPVALSVSVGGLPGSGAAVLERVKLAQHISYLRSRSDAHTAKSDHHSGLYHNSSCTLLAGHSGSERIHAQPTNENPVS